MSEPKTFGNIKVCLDDKAEQASYNEYHLTVSFTVRTCCIYRSRMSRKHYTLHMYAHTHTHSHMHMHTCTRTHTHYTTLAFNALVVLVPVANTFNAPIATSNSSPLRTIPTPSMFHYLQS